MLNYSNIADRLFKLLEKVIIPEALTQITLREEADESSNDEIRNMVAASLSKDLPLILPGASVWFKNETKPNNEIIWIVSPYESHIMGKTITSIALSENENLTIGIYVDFSEGRVITGVKNEGAFCDQEQYHCNNKKLSQDTSVMQFVTLPGGPGKVYVQSIMSLQDSFGFTMRYNNIAENIGTYMIFVAQGIEGLVLATGFNYHDVAATICIAEHAGAVVADFNGGQAGLLSGDAMLCCNKEIAGQIQQRLKNYVC